ncbi:DUF1499 domain-containing protein [Plasticicumulans acidivorans]|uniref:Uncharacterized protein DUF1499 n=1 Tax=Plasticicumulans acidivorans TaxID=886464 RepID=A0A317MYC3_9GAMM|nr:DUF1499 domain-containing protein [Plasticicumulans acidivorans]PWV64615.1 uncharacterized protein DUF1499 [Plasticicumulans acidivorans]
MNQLLMTLFAAGGSLIVGALILNCVPLNDKPGSARRLWIYLSKHVAETRHGHPCRELELRIYRLPPARLFERVAHVVDLLNWELLESDPAGKRLHAVARTPLLHLRSDVEIELKLGDRGTELHVRSSTRHGRAGDLGANTRHIMELHATLERML